MHVLQSLAFALMAGVFHAAIAVPVITVHPGNANDIIITKENTVNASTPAPTHQNFRSQIATTEKLPISLVNNFAGGAINAYVTGLDDQNRLVMLQPDGTFYYPTADKSIGTPQAITANVAIPLGAKGSTTNVTLPGYISSARIWLAEGELEFFTVYSWGTGGPSLVEPSAFNPSDPSANVNWGFVELTNTEAGGLYANISYVDFVGLVLGMSLQSPDGVQSAQGLASDAVTQICNALKAQTAQDGQPWGDLCQVDTNGNPLRVIAPNAYVSTNPTAFESYWDSYINEVWTTYTTNPLTINTQAAAGNVNCTVKNGSLQCEGDNRAYPKPVAGDIFGCNSGPFGIISTDNDVHRAIVPRLCAAFTRTTLLMNGGHIQPGLSSANYYASEPTSWYSKFVHQHEMDGKGYAFSYDDVNPDFDINQSGVVADPNPELLTVIVGGPLSTGSGWSS